MNKFNWWWYDLGSEIKPQGKEDTEEFAHRIAKEAYDQAINDALEIVQDQDIGYIGIMYKIRSLKP